MSLKFRGGWPFRNPPNSQFRLNTNSPQVDGLVAWWPMAASRGIIAPVRDLAADRFPMTQYNSPTWVNSEFGPCLLFDNASNEYLLNNSVVSDIPLTFSCWFNIDSTGNHGLIATSENPGGWEGRWLGIANPTSLQAREYDGVVKFAQATTTVTVGQWQHATGIFASSTDRRVFLDGSNKGTDSDNCAPSGIVNTSIGAIITGGSIEWPMSGYIADTRIYNRALSDAEVYQLYDPATRWELYQPIPRIFVIGKFPGQPTNIRATTVPHLRQWQPRIHS